MSTKNPRQPKLERRIPGVYGTFDRRSSALQIRVGPCVKLDGPNGGVYLPCESCGTVYEVNANVVSFECGACFAVDPKRVEEIFEQLEVDNRTSHEADDVDDDKWAMMMFHYGATDILFGHYDERDLGEAFAEDASACRDELDLLEGCIPGHRYPIECFSFQAYRTDSQLALAWSDCARDECSDYAEQWEQPCGEEIEGATVELHEYCLLKMLDLHDVAAASFPGALDNFGPVCAEGRAPRHDRCDPMRKWCEDPSSF